MSRITLLCNDCHTVFRIVVADNPLSHDPPYHCLYCGSQNTYPSQDSDRDYWEVLSESYSLPIPVLKLFYGAWTQSPDGYTRFGDYLVPAMKKILEQSQSKVEQ